jgi:hypothetical protein
MSTSEKSWWTLPIVFQHDNKVTQVGPVGRNFTQILGLASAAGLPILVWPDTVAPVLQIKCETPLLIDQLSD